MTQLAFYENKKQKKLLTGLFLLAFCVRMIFVCLNLLSIPFPGANSGDQMRFISVATVNDPDNISLLTNLSQSYIYSLVIALLFTLTGSVKVVPLMLNAVLGSATIVQIYLSAKLLTDKKYAKAIGLLATFTPTLIFLSAVMLREAIIIFFISVYFHQIILWFKFQKTRNFLAALASVLAASIFHGAFVFLIALTLPTILTKGLRFSVIIKSSVVFVLVSFLVFYATFEYKIGATKIGFLYEDDLRADNMLEFFKDRINNVIQATPQDPLYRGYDRVRVFVELLWASINIFFSFLFAPFFVKTIGLASAAKLPESLLYGLLVILSPLCLFSKNASLKYLVLVMWFNFFLFAIGSSSISQANRHFFKLAPMLLPLSSIYLKALSKLVFNKNYIHESGIEKKMQQQSARIKIMSVK